MGVPSRLALWILLLASVTGAVTKLCGTGVLDVSGVCQPCPVGFVCDERNLLLAAAALQPGFWRRAGDSLSTVSCERHCRGGGPGDTGCAAGWSGFACRVCDGTTDCMDCDDDSQTIWVLLVSIVGILVLLLPCYLLPSQLQELQEGLPYERETPRPEEKLKPKANEVGTPASTRSEPMETVATEQDKLLEQNRKRSSCCISLAGRSLAAIQATAGRWRDATKQMGKGQRWLLRRATAAASAGSIGVKLRCLGSYYQITTLLADALRVRLPPEDTLHGQLMTVVGLVSAAQTILLSVLRAARDFRPS